MAEQDTARLERQEKFLEAFVDCKGDADKARTASDVTRTEFFNWLQSDEVFRARVDQFRVLLAEDIENEAVRRVLSPEGQRGSDALATTLLKGLRRERYAEKPEASATSVVYISGLRDAPRVGTEGAPDAAEGKPAGPSVPDK